MFIQTEDTPNPATMKFLPGRLVAENPIEMKSPGEAAVSPLAEVLFRIDGVTGVFLGRDFISVTKADGAEWQALRPDILSTIMDHFAQGLPVLRGEETPSPLQTSHDEGDVVAKIRELLDKRIRPAVAQDGGDVAFEGFENGIVFLRLKGACAGCPSATATLKFGIEQMLRHFIPEVQEVRQVR